MSRYIDADMAYEIARTAHKDFRQSMADLTSLREVLEDTPTADVVEVVRCKDCIYHIAEYCTRDIKGRTNMFYMTADDFCSYGERKDGAET